MAPLLDPQPASAMLQASAQNMIGTVLSPDGQRVAASPITNLQVQDGTPGWEWVRLNVLRSASATSTPSSNSAETTDEEFGFILVLIVVSVVAVLGLLMTVHCLIHRKRRLERRLQNARREEADEDNVRNLRLILDSMGTSRQAGREQSRTPGPASLASHRGVIGDETELIDLNFPPASGSERISNPLRAVYHGPRVPPPTYSGTDFRNPRSETALL